MTPSEVRNAIMSRYLVEFSGQFPIAIDNQIYTKPATPEPWVRLTVLFADGNQDSLGKSGNRKYLRMGTIVIQTFVVANKATDLSDQMVENNINLFDGERLSQSWYFDGRPVTVGNDGEYWQQNAVIDFKYENIR